MQISTLQLVGKELHAFHVHSQMHQLESLINLAGMDGEGDLSLTCFVCILS